MRTFETELTQHQSYLKCIARRCVNKNPLYDFDDVLQEFLMTLWRCLEKYPELPDKQFHSVLSMSVAHTIANIVRSGKKKLSFIRIQRREDRGDDTEYLDNLKSDQTNYVASDFYAVEIARLLAQLDTKTRAAVEQIMTPSQTKRNFRAVPGSLDALNKVRDLTGDFV